MEKREEILKLWSDYLGGKKDLKVGEFDRVRDEVIKIIEMDYDVVKCVLNKIGVKYSGYIEVDGRDVYLVLNFGDVRVYYDGFGWEIINGDNIKIVNDLRGVLGYLVNLN